MGLMHLVLLGITLHLSSGLSLESGSCSMSCKNVSSQLTQSNGDSSPVKFLCSCSSSCSVYGDCCYDSPFRSGGDSASQRSHTMCLSVSGRGKFRAVARCPGGNSSDVCTGSLGHLPPVTSRTTGTTYANVFCATCHGDADKLKTWNVEIRCCPELEARYQSGEKRYTYHKGNIWKTLTDRHKCPCRYYVHYNDYSFTDGLELRTCEKRIEIATCSSTWTENTERKLCDSFLDPVYIGDKVYRNSYCALCNYVRLDAGNCLPPVVRQMLESNANVEDILQHCKQHNLKTCLHFFNLWSNSRGRQYKYSELMSINVQTCFPEPGKRCCKGERYDWKNKRCRKLVKGDSR